MFVIAHVSDTHFGNEVQDPATRNTLVMDHLLAMDPRPDVLVVTGDVADHGLPEEYAAARAWLDRWDGPLAVCPGNHDVRDAFVAGLGIATRTVVEAGGSRFVMLDSLVDADETGRVDPGRLGEDQLAWLDARLAEDAGPAYVCLHHPPTTIGLALMDPIRLRDGDALAAVVGPSSAGRRGPRRPCPHDGDDDLRRAAAADRWWGRVDRDRRRRGVADPLVRRPAELRPPPGRRRTAG